MFWNVGGKRGFLSSFETKDIFEDKVLSNDVIFLSETMTTEPFPSLRFKNFYSSEAVATEGRPSGGLDLYYPGHIKGEELGSSAQHLVLKMEQCYFIGVYYKPTMEFDDLILDLLKALSYCSDATVPIILGGDFNIHEGEANFDNLVNLLHTFDLSLVSNPNEHTFVGPQGSSTPDHVFCTPEVEVLSCEVPLRFESLHRPIVVELRIQFEHESRRIPKSLNIEDCQARLLQLHALGDKLSPTELACELNNTLESCKQVVQQPRDSSFSHHIHCLRQEVNDALSLYQKYKNSFFKDVYFRARREYRRAIMLNKRRLKDRQVAGLIEATARNGTRALFKSARTSKLSNLSSQIPLRTWFDYYSDLFQTFEEPSFKEVSLAPSEDALNLLQPCTVEEVLVALNHQSSKARGL